MLQELVRAFAMLRDSRVRGVLWLGIGLSLATLVALFVGVEALVSWASDTGWAWLDRTFQVLGGLGTAIVAWFLFPSIVVAVSSIFLERVVDATEDRYYPQPAAAAPGAPDAVRAGGLEAAGRQPPAQPRWPCPPTSCRCSTSRSGWR